MTELTAVVLIVVIASAVWVAADSSSHGMTWVVWGGGTLLLWIVVFPLYLVERKKFAGPGPRLRNDLTVAEPNGHGHWEPDPANPNLERWREGSKWARSVRARQRS